MSKINQETEVKAVEKVQKKQSRLVSVFTKEYKHEGLVLLILAIIAIVLGVILLTEEFGLTLRDVYLIGDYPAVFSWILIGLGAASLILAIWPFYKPSIEEMKRVSWPTKGLMLRDSTTALLFSVIMALFFLLVDSLLFQFTDWLNTL